MMSKATFKKYLGRFLILSVVLGMLLTLIYPISLSLSHKEIIFYVCLGVILFLMVVYWIYIVIYEYRKKKKELKYKLPTRKK